MRPTQNFSIYSRGSAGFARETVKIESISVTLSWKATSSPAFARTTPVTPPMVKRKMNPKAKRRGVLKSREPPHRVANQLKILIPVGMAIIIVAAVK